MRRDGKSPEGNTLIENGGGRHTVQLNIILSEN